MLATTAINHVFSILQSASVRVTSADSNVADMGLTIRQPLMHNLCSFLSAVSHSSSIFVSCVSTTVELFTFLITEQVSFIVCKNLMMGFRWGPGPTGPPSWLRHWFHLSLTQHTVAALASGKSARNLAGARVRFSKDHKIFHMIIIRLS